MRLKVVRDSPTLDVKGSAGRPARLGHVTLEDNRVVSRPGDGQRSRESCDAASGDDKLHMAKLSDRRGRVQPFVVSQASAGAAAPVR